MFQAIIHEGIEVVEGLVIGSFGVHAEIIIDQRLKYFWVFEDIGKEKVNSLQHEQHLFSRYQSLFEMVVCR